MIDILFEPDAETMSVSGLWQYDEDQEVIIRGLDVPPVVEVAFSLTEFVGSAIPEASYVDDYGAIHTVITNSLLWDETQTQNYIIYGFVRVTKGESAETIAKIKLKVKARPKSDGTDIPIDRPPFEIVVEKVRELTEQAIDARDSAERASEDATASLEELKMGIASGDFKGDPGTGIAFAEQTVTSDEPFGINVFTIILTDGTVATISVRNGKDGTFDPSAIGQAVEKYLSEHPVKVPKKVSELENDSGFVTEEDIPSPYDDTKIKEDISETNTHLSALSENKVGYSEVVYGQLLMYADETKEHLLATLDLPSGGGISDVKIGEDSIVTDGVAKIPRATYSKPNGIPTFNNAYGITINKNDNVTTNPASNDDINTRNYGPKPITVSNMDYAVTAVLTDGKAPALTEEQQASAQAWLGILSSEGVLFGE